jgi:hypothetical protein
MARIDYFGKNGNPEIEAEKIEGLRIANMISRAKLARIEGEVVAKREVQFVISHALATLRERILRLPAMIAAELRGFDHPRVHGVRTRVDDMVRRSLDESAETLAHAVSAKDFFAELIAEEQTKEQIAIAERKRDAANAKRRAKYHRKHAD